MCCVGYSKRKLLRNPRKSPQSAVSGTPGIKGSAAAQNFLRYLFVKYWTMWDYKILEHVRVLLIYTSFFRYLFLKYFRILYSYARFLTVFCLWNISQCCAATQDFFTYAFVKYQPTYNYTRFPSFTWESLAFNHKVSGFTCSKTGHFSCFPKTGHNVFFKIFFSNPNRKLYSFKTRCRGGLFSF